MNSVAINSNMSKSALQRGMEEDRAGQDKESQQIVDLGRIFESQIEAYIKASNQDISGKIVLGACDYIIKTYKERMATLGENYGRLKRLIESEGIKIREPYVNDGIMPREAGFDPGVMMPGAGGLLRK